MESHEIQKMYELEEFHYWFKAKRELIIDLYKKYCKPGLALDVGCGTGAISKALKKFTKVISCDFSDESVRYSKIRNPDIEVIRGNAESLAFKSNMFDVLVSSDLLEHVENDNKAMKEFNRVLKKDGKLILTVPAFQFLWSKDDVSLGHHRRYTKNQIRNLLERNNYKIEFINYWNFTLFPAYLAYKFVNKSSSATKVPEILNKLLHLGFRFDSKLIQYITVPWGTSVVAVATKK